MLDLDVVKREWHTARRGDDVDAVGWAGRYADELLALARAGRKMYEAGQSMLDATVEGNIKLGHQKELDSALAAWRGADGG